LGVLGRPLMAGLDHSRQPPATTIGISGEFRHPPNRPRQGPRRSAASTRSALNPHSAIRNAFLYPSANRTSSWRRRRSMARLDHWGEGGATRIDCGLQIADRTDDGNGHGETPVRLRSGQAFGFAQGKIMKARPGFVFDYAVAGGGVFRLWIAVATATRDCPSRASGP